MNKLLSFLLISLILLPPQLRALTPVVNSTGHKLKVIISYKQGEETVLLAPNQTQNVSLPYEKVTLSALVHTNIGYKDTGITKLKRKIKRNRKLVLFGEFDNHFQAKVKK